MIGKIRDIIKTKYGSLTDLQKKIYLKSFSVVAVLMLTMTLLFTITAAWYSNIVEVEEITFEADSWGVDALIELNEEKLYKAAPGDIEIIPYTVSNNADRLINIQFNAYKKYLPDFMQERIYFYLDDKTEVNGETVDRIYIHDDNAYYYPLLGGQVVDNVITGEKDVVSDPPLKWEWVYDLLGYYTVIRTDEKGNLKETAYIRPVQYTYERATYDYTTGQLLTIRNDDGTVSTRDEFMMNLLATDGLLTGVQKREGFEAKEFTSAEQLKVQLPFKDITGAVDNRTYYEVYRDEVSGYGIYIYLCDYNEIMLNNKIDADIADKVNVYQMTEEHFAVVQLSCGQAMEYFIDISTAEELITLMKNEPVEVQKVTDNEDGTQTTETVEIGAYEKLLKEKNLWEDRDYVIIRLNADISMAPQVIKDCNMIIDLNGKTITSTGTAEESLFTLNPDCSLKMYNGTLNPGGGVPFETTGATVVLRDIFVNTTGAAVEINTNNYPQGSKVQIIDCTWAEGIAEDHSAITVTDAENDDVPSFVYIRELAEESGETEGEATGEVTE